MKNHFNNDTWLAIIIALILFFLGLLMLELAFPADKVSAQESLGSRGEIVMAEDGTEKIRISSRDFYSLKDEIDGLFIELEDTISDSGLVH